MASAPSPFRVRYADLDPAGHMYFARYLDCAHEGMNWFWAERGLSVEVREREGFELAFVHVELDYRGRALAGDAIEVEVKVKKVRTTSLVSTFALRRAADGTLLAEGEAVQVCFDLGTSDKRVWPEPYLQMLRDAAG